MSSETIGKFFGELGFKVDFTGLNLFERRLKALTSKINNVGKQMQKALNVKPALAGQTAQLKALQNITAKMGKAQAAANNLALATQQKAAALGLTQAKVAAQNAKTQQASTLAALKASHQQLRNQSANTQHLTQQQRLQKATNQTQLSAMRVQRAMSGGLGGLAGARAAGIQMPTFSGFTGALSVAAGGAMALGLAALGAAAAMKSYVDAVTTAGQTQTGRISQFAAGYDVAGADPTKVQKQGKEANFRFLGVADELGLDASSIGADYTKNRTNLMDAGMSDSKAEKTLHGFLSFGKGTGMTSDAMKGVMNAMGQSLSKGQLMSEEWKSQIAEHLPGAGKLGGEAYQKVIGGKLTGEKATAALSDAMAKGLIKGDTVKKFYETVAQLMERDANRGGRLDVAKNNAESQTNRRTNVTSQVLANAYTSDNGAMGKALLENSKAQVEFISKLGPIAEKMAGLGTASIGAMTDLTKGMTDLVPAVGGMLTGMEAVGDKFTEAAKNVSDGVSIGAEQWIKSFKPEAFSTLGDKMGGMWDSIVKLTGSLDFVFAAIGALSGHLVNLAASFYGFALTPAITILSKIADILTYIGGKFGYVSQGEKDNTAYNEKHPNRLNEGSGLKPLVTAPAPSDNVVLSQMANSPIVGGLLKLHESKAFDRLQKANMPPVGVMPVDGGSSAAAVPSTTTVTNDIKLGDINLTVTSTATNTADLMKEVGPMVQQAVKEAAKQGVNEAQAKSGTAGILVQDTR